jgi:H+/Cl- antiporter ClcA
MNKSPLNHLLSAAVVAILWVVFAVLMGSYLTENPNLAEKDPNDLASELRIFFGLAALLSIIFSSYWYAYGSNEKTAGELPHAKKKWNTLFIILIIYSVALVVAIIMMNLKEGIEPKWYGIYFGLLATLTFISFWINTFLMSPKTVKYIPIGKR